MCLLLYKIHSLRKTLDKTSPLYPKLYNSDYLLYMVCHMYVPFQKVSENVNSG